MKNQSQQRTIAIALLLGYVLLMTLAGWCTYRVYQWVTELPDRIVVDIDQQTVQQVFIESTKVALLEGPKEQRMEIIQYLADAGPDAKPFLSTLTEAASDPDPDIAEAANRAITLIDVHDGKQRGPVTP